MAKKRKGGFGVDRLPNRKYVTVAWAAASTTAVYTQFDTMMGAREGAGWLISRVDVGWQGPIGGSIGVTNCVRFQLLTGAQTAPLAVDDDEVIASIDRANTVNTQGAGQLDWPVTWVGPVLVASRQLSCVMDATADGAPYQTVGMLFTIWYNWVQLGAKEWVEIAEARGIG